MRKATQVPQLHVRQLVFSIFEIIVIVICYLAIGCLVWRFKNVSYDDKTRFKGLIVFLAWLSYIIIYGNLMDMYPEEIKLLSANKQHLVTIIHWAITGGVLGYCGSLVINFTEKRRVSDYLEKVSKTQKFRHKGKK